MPKVQLRKVDPDTLSVTHIFDGEEVVSGGDCGQVQIAVFADAEEAARYVALCRAANTPVRGWKAVAD